MHICSISQDFKRISRITIEFHIEKISDLKTAVLQALRCEKPVVINVEVDPEAIYSFRRDSFKHRQS